MSAADPPPLHCDAAALADVDLDTVAALAQLALIARRMGCRLVVRRASAELVALLDLAGLAGSRSGPDGALVIEVAGQAELREEPLGVEEEGEPDDRAV